VSSKLPDQGGKPSVASLLATSAAQSSGGQPVARTPSALSVGSRSSAIARHSLLPLADHSAHEARVAKGDIGSGVAVRLGFSFFSTSAWL